jgi:two-component system OmpR family sensor kinase
MLDSVRVRLTIWYGGLLALVLILLAGLSYFLYYSHTMERTDSYMIELSNSFVTTLNAELPDQTGPNALKAAALQSMIEHRFRGSLFVILDSTGKRVADSSELPDSSPAKEKLDVAVLDSPEFQSLALAPDSSLPAYRSFDSANGGLRAYARNLTVAGQPYRLVLLQSLHTQHEMLEDIRSIFYSVIPVVLLLACLGGYFLARRNLAPVVAMASQARGMGADRLQDRLAVANPRDELGQLALSFNQLLDRLEDSFERQRRFIADASHELRTPVAILLGETEVTLSRADRTPAEYREALAILNSESQRLSHTIEDLFTLTRADAGQLPLALRDVYLDELASDLLRQSRSLAFAKNIKLNSGITPDLLAHADEALLRRMILNLLDNAIKHTSSGGTVSLECKKQGDFYVFSVSDTGSGVPSELQQKIFERFFRVDKARSRGESDTGGAGLGLAIARWIAEAHHGRLELVRSDSTGSTFSAFLPASNNLPRQS